MKKIAIVFMLVCGALTSCNIESISQKKDNLTAKDFKTITVDSLYSLRVPRYMKEMKSLNDDASLAYANVFKEAYTIVIDEPIDEVMTSFKEYEIYKEEKSPLENYDYYQIESFKESIENLEITPLKTKTINGYPVKQYVFKGEVENIQISYLISLIESESDLFMIMSWTLTNRFERFKDSFIKSHDSFKSSKKN
ncbi:hypothetical protein [Tenacibaculum sp. M341]|uniref:hypothetical protein n=1 Tax=Tenacibaculum sp. M341 TaxID=2530339 RepID=UPI00104476F8|nr:hypothetical protein [Tenacibaculum sp. M341]TCI91020.1 hypothetical protein EYW44_11760 [Tenacibaculum sp. M341]